MTEESQLNEIYLNWMHCCRSVKHHLHHHQELLSSLMTEESQLDETDLKLNWMHCCHSVKHHLHHPQELLSLLMTEESQMDETDLNWTHCCHSVKHHLHHHQELLSSLMTESVGLELEMLLPLCETRLPSDDIKRSSLGGTASK